MGSSNAITVLADSGIYSNPSRICSHGRVNFVQSIRVFDGLRVPIQESDGVISTRPYVHIWKAPCNIPYNGLSCPILNTMGYEPESEMHVYFSLVYMSTMTDAMETMSDILISSTRTCKNRKPADNIKVNQWIPELENQSHRNLMLPATNTDL